jgi:CubicO group peptidase (beta-lactamase class C family)
MMSLNQRRSFIAGLAALLAAPIAPSAGLAQASRQGAAIPAAALDSARARIRRLMDSTKVPSLAVAVARNGRIIWEEGFGIADSARNARATPTTLYSMASISKPITATGIMKLVEQGKIDLDRPANDYLGAAKITGLAGDASGATVRRVLAHTAGLPLHYRFFYAGGPVARPSMDEAISRYAITVYPPGAVYNYSNLGYGVLEEIIARDSGRSYEDFMRDEVFVPLGMSTTTIGTGAGLANSAVRYFNGKPVAFYDFDHRAASAVYTSARELVRFGMFHLKSHLRDQQPILKDATIDAMQRVTTPGDTTSGYGLGWLISTEQGKKVVSHTGGMPGVATTLKLYPEHDVVITVLGNGSGGITGLAPHRAAFIVAGAVLPNYDAEVATRGALGQGGAGFSTLASMWGEWTGTIRTYDGKTTPITFLVKPDDVHVRIGDRSALWTVLNGASFRNDMLGGRFVGTIPSEEARRFPHDIGVSLLPRDGKLQGWAAAMTTDDPPTGAISSYVELTKSGGARAR